MQVADYLSPKRAVHFPRPDLHSMLVVAQWTVGIGEILLNPLAQKRFLSSGPGLLKNKLIGDKQEEGKMRFPNFYPTPSQLIWHTN